MGGFAFAFGQFACSNYISVELTDIVASLLSAGAIVALLQVWSPTEPLRGEVQGGAQPAIAGAAVARRDPRARGQAQGGQRARLDRARSFAAFTPYIIIIVVFALAQWEPIKDFLDARTYAFDWPGLDVLNPKGEAPSSVDVQVQLGQRGGHAAARLGPAERCSCCASSPGRALRTLGRTLYELKWATLTVATVLALAYVMNLSGQTITLGHVDRRRGRRCSGSCHRSSAGSASR